MRNLWKYYNVKIKGYDEEKAFAFLDHKTYNIQLFVYSTYSNENIVKYISSWKNGHNK